MHDPGGLRLLYAQSSLVLNASARSFSRNRGLLRAASLAFYSFMALPPLLLLVTLLVLTVIESFRSVLVTLAPGPVPVFSSLASVAIPLLIRSGLLALVFLITAPVRLRWYELLLGAPRTATARAGSDGAEPAAVSPPALDELLRDNPDIMLELLRELARRLQENNHLIAGASPPSGTTARKGEPRQ